MNQINVSILKQIPKNLFICPISKDGVKVGTEIEYFI